MKLLVSLLVIYVGFVKCDEGCTEPIQDFNITALKGITSYAIFTYENSNEKNVSCTTNIIDTDYNVKKIYLYSNGESKTVNGKLDVDKMCKCNPGRLITVWPSGFPLIKYVVYNDDDFRIVIACLNGVGNLNMLLL